jgi:hypothetical protein
MRNGYEMSGNVQETGSVEQVRCAADWGLWRWAARCEHGRFRCAAGSNNTVRR